MKFFRVPPGPPTDLLRAYLSGRPYRLDFRRNVCIRVVLFDDDAQLREYQTLDWNGCDYSELGQVFAPTELLALARQEYAGRHAHKTATRQKAA